jgi:hypothetical protein
MQPGVTPATKSSTGLILALVAVLVAAVLVGVVLLYQQSRPTPAATETGTVIPETERPTGLVPAPGEPGAADEEAEPEPEPEPAPVPAEDRVAEATVVLENYLAADLGHDGKEMARYLGGQAAARFRPEVQGQEDLTVHSKKVTGHTVKDANTVVFAVEVEWSPSDSDDLMLDKQRYVVRRTDKGWKITSTPEYPG